MSDFYVNRDNIVTLSPLETPLTTSSTPGNRDGMSNDPQVEASLPAVSDDTTACQISHPKAGSNDTICPPDPKEENVSRPMSLGEYDSVSWNETVKLVHDHVTSGEQTRLLDFGDNTSIEATSSSCKGKSDIDTVVWTDSC